MSHYIARRLAYTLLIVLGVVTVVFLLLHLTGDPTALYLSPEATAEDRARLAREIGLDRPLWVRYVEYVSRATVGDFGQSFKFPEPAIRLVLERLPATLRLTGIAMGISLLLAVPLAVLAAVYRNSVFDLATMSFALFGQCMPTFWLGIMLILVFSVTLGWLPPSGAGDWRHYVMPALTLGLYSAAIVARLLRSSLLEIFASDHIRTARAKGLAERAVIVRHALRNASLPVVTVFGLQVGALLGGAVVTEFIFAYPGVGRLVLQAISGRDFPVVQAFVVVIAVTISLINLLVDLAYALLDPRIRYAG